MPKRQPTAAKKARTAARRGRKYTDALREEQARSDHQGHRARSHWSAAVFDIVNSPGFQATLALANSPAVQAAQDAMNAAMANSSAVRAAQEAIANSSVIRSGQTMLGLVNSAADAMHDLLLRRTLRALP